MGELWTEQNQNDIMYFVCIEDYVMWEETWNFFGKHLTFCRISLPETSTVLTFFVPGLKTMTSLRHKISSHLSVMYLKSFLSTSLHQIILLICTFTQTRIFQENVFFSLGLETLTKGKGLFAEIFLTIR